MCIPPDHDAGRPHLRSGGPNAWRKPGAAHWDLMKTSGECRVCPVARSQSLIARVDVCRLEAGSRCGEQGSGCPNASDGPFGPAGRSPPSACVRSPLGGEKFPLRPSGRSFRQLCGQAHCGSAAGPPAFHCPLPTPYSGCGISQVIHGGRIASAWRPRFRLWLVAVLP